MNKVTLAFAAATAGLTLLRSTCGGNSTLNSTAWT